ncbi:MAG: hypothetical protein QHJ73_10290 [Armatimonadota bacterium]|nr:hypothetical protein [Armatimonadota bacterium]
MKQVYRAVLTALLLMAVSVAAWAEEGQALHQPGEQTVIAEGKAPIVGGNLTAAERAAKADATRNAIEQAIGVYVKAESKNQLAALVDDWVKTSSGGFATIKRVFDQKQEDGVYSLKVEAVVSKVPALVQLQKSGILREWRVMVIIPEQILRRPVPDPAAETEFIRQFVQAGFKVIDQNRYKELRGEFASRLKDPAAAAEIGRKMGADIVIVGEAFAEEVGDVLGNTGFVTARARVETRAILADTAEIVAADATEGPAADISAAVAGKKALQQTARLLAPRLVQDIMLIPPSDIRQLQVEVHGFQGITMAGRFQRALAEMQGVSKVNRESFDAGVLVLGVATESESAEALAEAIETDTKIQAAVKPLKVTVTNASKTRIIVELRK